MPIRRITLGDIIREHRRSYADAIAVVDGAHRNSWPEFDDRVNRLANALLGEGVTRGDRVLWLGQNSFRIYELLGACAKVGAMVCPAYWRWAPPEMAYAIQDFSPTVIIWQDQEIGDTVRQARAEIERRVPARWLRHDTEGDGSYEAFLASGSPEDPAQDVDPDGALLVIYSAAMYGRPVGSMLSHTNLINQGMSTAWLADIDHTGAFLNSGPMFHIGNFQFFGITTLIHGGKNVVVRRVDAEEVLRIVAAERCTHAYLMPPTIEQMVKLNADRRYDLSSLRASFSPHLWGDMASPDTSRYARSERGLGSGYGQTELSGLAVLGGYGGKSIGNSGRPSPFTAVRILDRDGRECGVGEPGEICVKGDLVHLGYWNRPEINAERFQHGYWHTTDVGQREADGSITFLGTSTRMIKSAAENIFPVEVEMALESHPAVAEAAVIGIPNERWAQEVKAVVVLTEGSSATADEVIEHCRSQIASYKKPRTVEFVDALPRTTSGAKDYDALDERFGGGGYPGGTNLGAGH
jgi:acyl-CoA synthetase (AMP-forming)/AMP-acid ligase II